MAPLLALVIALIPIAIAPGLLFYFDVTPKTLVLLGGVPAAALVWAGSGGSIGFVRTSRWARWFTYGLLGAVASLALSTALSVNPALSVGGSRWRCWGLVVQLAALALAWLVAACCAANMDRVRLLLLALSAAGLITALYGIAQYFGLDPFLDARGYHAGEGIYRIVRPPSTLGHADYFASWQLAAVFASAALERNAKALWWRWLAWASMAFGIVAIVLSGTRSAMLGLLAGAAVLVMWRGLRISWRSVAAAGIVLGAATAFYFSPAGASLRARVHWSFQEPAGGARFLLWRDTLRMSAARWPMGYGPETYIAAFAHAQSPELAQSFPDFYHESPHNIFLDALVSQGVPGVLSLAALCAIGIGAAGSLRTPPGRARDTAGALLGGLIAIVMAGQFVCFMLPTALACYILIALLVSLTCGSVPPLSPRRRWPALAAAFVMAAVCATLGVRLLIAETALAAVNRDLNAGSVAAAVDEYSTYQDWRLPGSSADVWYSRRLIEIARRDLSPSARLLAIQQASTAALRAPQTSDDPFNAFYNLAEFYAARNDFNDTEQSLRSALAEAPNWFKPHWMLAQVLFAARRLPEAETEATRAIALGGGRHVEVTQTLEQIRTSLHVPSDSPPHK